MVAVTVKIGDQTLSIPRDCRTTRPICGACSDEIQVGIFSSFRLSQFCMNHQYNEPGSALFSIPDIILPGLSTDKHFDNDSSWEESLMIESKLTTESTSPGQLQINPPLPKQLFLASPSPALEGIPIQERPPTFPHLFGGLSRTFPLSLGTSSLDYSRTVEGVPGHGVFKIGEDCEKRMGHKRQRNGSRHPVPPSSSFTFYANECRTRMLRARPDLALTDVNREIGRSWTSISAVDRQKYHEMEKDDQLRYQREIDALSGEESSQNALKRRKRDSKAPKHPISAYLFFVAETRARLCKECPDMGFGEMAKLIGTRWKEMMAADRSRYEEMAERDKTRYEREFQSFTKGEDAEGFVRAANRNQVENSKRRKRAHNAPKHPISAYLFFVAEQRRALSATCPGKSFKELATEIGIRWKNLSDEDREPYLLSASTDKERYEREKEEMAGLINPCQFGSPSKNSS